MDKLDEILNEYKIHCNMPFGTREEANPKCQLSVDQVAEVEELIQLALWYDNKILSPKLRTEFEVRINKFKSHLDFHELLDVLKSL